MSAEVLIWVDGVESKFLRLPDRGLDYGDGLFETLLLVDSRPLYLDLHLQRLKSGLAALGFPTVTHKVAQQIDGILRSRTFPPYASMRVTVTRGGGPRGYTVPELPSPRVIVSVYPMPDNYDQRMLAPAQLALADIAWGHQPKLAGIKHLNRLEQVLAASERQGVGADEVVVRDQDQQLVSVSAGNLFLVMNDALHTPRLTNCGVLGTRRRLVLEKFAAAAGLPVYESDLVLADFEAASEVFYCNTLIGFRPVSGLGDLRWSSHPVCKSIHRLYCEDSCK